jgi:N-acetylneuraminic acid mutarotase
MKASKIHFQDGIYPSGRVGSSLVSHEDSLYIFGGQNLLKENKYEYLNDIWSCNILNLQWENVKYKGDSPEGRYGHNSHVVKDTLYIFFGRGENGKCFNDVFTFHLKSHKWKQLSFDNKKVPKRRYKM